MTTLSKAILELAKIITNVVESTATGGSTTTLIDTTRTEPDDYFTSGTIWFLSGNNAGKSTKTLSFQLSTKTFTFAAQSGSVAGGDKYAVIPLDYPRYILIQAVNAALQAIGSPKKYDESLVTVADQESYTLPSGVSNVKSVKIAMSSVAPYWPVPHTGWNEVDGTIKFLPGREISEAGYKIYLEYCPPPTELTADSDTIDDEIHIELVKRLAAVEALTWRLPRIGTQEAVFLQLLNKAILEAERAKKLYGLPVIHRDPNTGNW